MAPPLMPANIGPKGRRARLIFGLVLLAAGLALIVGGVAADARWWLVVIFMVFWLGSLGVLQARGHT